MHKFVRKLVSLFFLFVFLVPASVLAQESKTASQSEERAKALFFELRCVVCQNQSIGDSNADVARDLRKIVRQQIATGKSDQEIRDFLVLRYGEVILLKPSFGVHTILLWGSPVLLLLIGMFFIFRFWNSSRQTDWAPLSEEEKKELELIRNRRT